MLNSMIEKEIQLTKENRTCANFLRQKSKNNKFQSPSTQVPKYPSTQSQSLIETIVAISIIVIAIVAILAVGLTLLVLGGQSAERIMAVNLTREGMEVVYAIVYSHRLDPNETWPYGLSLNDDFIADYDAADLTPATFDGSETIVNCLNCHLCKGDGDLHTHCAQQEVFRRMITIADGDNLTGNCGGDCEKKIISTVYWLERNGFHTVTLESRLTDWR